MSRLLYKLSLAVLMFTVVSLLLGACGGAGEPVPTPQPTATLLAGWKRITAKNISIALPDTFEGGDLLGPDRKIIVDRIKSMGADFAHMAAVIEQNPELFLLFFTDNAPTNSSVLTNMNITQEQVLSSISPKAYMEAAAKQLPAAFKIKAQDELTISGRSAGRMITELADLNVKQVIYVIKDNNTVYVLSYTSGIDEFPQKFVTFEQSAQSFAINP